MSEIVSRKYLFKRGDYVAEVMFEVGGNMFVEIVYKGFVSKSFNFFAEKGDIYDLQDLIVEIIETMEGLKDDSE